MPSWQATIFLLVEIVGSTFYTLPDSFESLGWVISIGLLVAFCAINAMTTQILFQSHSLVGPAAVSFGDLAFILYGPGAATATFLLVVACRLFLIASQLALGAFMLQSFLPRSYFPNSETGGVAPDDYDESFASSQKQFIYGQNYFAGSCFGLWGLILAIAMILAIYFTRLLRTTIWISVVNVAAIVAVGIVVCYGKYESWKDEKDMHTTAWPGFQIESFSDVLGLLSIYQPLNAMCGQLVSKHASMHAQSKAWTHECMKD